MALEEWQIVEIREAVESGDYDASELVDGYLPIFYSDILKEWQNMPSGYDDRGAEEFGCDASEGIYRRMTLDLYVYYSDLVAEVVDSFENELAEAN